MRRPSVAPLVDNTYLPRDESHQCCFLRSIQNSIAKSSRIAVVLLGLLGAAVPATAQIIPLGGTEDGTILDATALTNTSADVITRNLALSPGSDVTGFLPGTIDGRAIHITDAVTDQARAGAL